MTDTDKKKRIADVEKQIAALKEELAELKRKDAIEVPHELLKSLGFRFQDYYWRKQRVDGSEVILEITDEYWDLEFVNDLGSAYSNVCGDTSESLVSELMQSDTWPKSVVYELTCELGNAKLVGIQIDAWDKSSDSELVRTVWQAIDDFTDDMKILEKKVIA